MRLRAWGAVAAAMVAFLGPELSASAASPVPFTDPAARGLITLCDSAGHAETTGSIYGKPFSWRAVGSTPAPKGYLGPGRTASLFAFQPIEQVDPTLWEGEFLTSGARYSSPDRPMAAATPVDPTLADYLGDYPTKWDGLVQLRLFVGAPQVPTYTQQYDTATLRVTGTTWTMLAGGTAGCGTGTSTSAETILPAVKSLPTPAPTAQSRPNSAPSSQAASSDSTTTTNHTAPSTSGSTGTSTAADPPAHHSSNSALVALLAVMVAAAIGLATFLIRRRTRSPG